MMEGTYKILNSMMASEVGQHLAGGKLKYEQCIMKTSSLWLLVEHDLRIAFPKRSSMRKENFMHYRVTISHDDTKTLFEPKKIR